MWLYWRRRKKRNKIIQKDKENKLVTENGMANKYWKQCWHSYLKNGVSSCLEGWNPPRSSKDPAEIASFFIISSPRNESEKRLTWLIFQ
jgi:hypothetical protein